MKIRIFSSFPDNARLKALLFLGVVAVLGTIWMTSELVGRRVEANLRVKGEVRLALYAQALKDNLEKHRHLPYLLARDRRVVNLLTDLGTDSQVNPHLEDFARASGALIFILDAQGTTVAASNWRSDQSLVGSNFAFRPYYQDAIRGEAGGYYAVGLKTGQPGFFSSFPVFAGSSLLGVVVVKTELEQLQENWQKSGETIMVSDSYGVLVLASNDRWKYRVLRPLPDETRDWLRQVQYRNQELAPLHFSRQPVRGGNHLQHDQERYLEQSLQLPDYGWRIHYLTHLQPVVSAKQLSASAGTMATALVLVYLLYLRERRLKSIADQQAREARAIQEVNQRLAQEVQQRRQTEKTLRDTQKELVQAGKLAALGRMSAAIAHELGQPVTAIRTFLASSRLLLERGMVDKVGENIEAIDGLTGRMASLTGQLKTFARKSRKKEETLDLHAIIERILGYFSPQIQAAGATSSFQSCGPDLALVRGDEIQLEQVLTNLLQNSLDALADQPQRALAIDLAIRQNRAEITVRDTGSGISQEAMELLFEPFFTTKEVGAGLGLGLSISYGIIIEMGGTMSADNLDNGGARFIISLPLA